MEWTFSQPACLELTHNWGTEGDLEFKGYCNGNVDPGKGFGAPTLCGRAGSPCGLQSGHRRRPAERC
jgi:hypothetical protein